MCSKAKRNAINLSDNFIEKVSQDRWKHIGQFSGHIPP